MRLCTWEEGCDSVCEGRTDFCATHNRIIRKMDKESAKAPKAFKPIPKTTEKQASAVAQYSREKGPWIKGKRCAVFPDQIATQIHHKAGKVGYIDEWARERGITALMDKRYWLPVSMEGHSKIELNPDWAKEMGFSVDRLTKKD